MDSRLYDSEAMHFVSRIGQKTISIWKNFSPILNSLQQRLEAAFSYPNCLLFSFKT